MKNLLVLFVLMTTGCTGISNQVSDILFIPNSSSDKRSNERTDLKLHFAECKPDINSRALVAAAPIATAVAEAVGKVLAEESKRYQASYSANTTQEGFYCEDGKTDVGEEMALAGISFTRYVDKSEPAMRFCAAVIPAANPSFFQIVPLKYELRKSKAKVIAFDLTSPFGIDVLNPWEVITDTVTGDLTGIPADNNVDLSLSLTLKSLFVSKGQLKEVSHSHSWKKTNFKIGNSDDNSILSESVVEDCSEMDSRPIEEIQKFTIQSLGLNKGVLLPKVIATKDDPLGVFNLKVAVEEFDAYGERIKELNSQFEKNKETLTKTLTDKLE